MIKTYCKLQESGIIGVNELIKHSDEYSNKKNLIVYNENMTKSQIKLIIFDIDGTLTEEVSWLKLTESLGADSLIHREIFSNFKLGKLSYGDAKTQLITLWQNTGNANKDFLSQQFSSWPLKKDAREVIEFLKNKFQIVLISGSIDLYVETVANKLNIATWYANTKIIWDGKGNLIDFEYEPNQAQKKLDQLKEYLKKNDFKKENCFVVGDGDSDLALFKELPHGIAVNKEPYPELEKLAWRKVSTLTEIIALIEMKLTRAEARGI